MLNALKLKSINLLTNNPAKRNTLLDKGIEVLKTISLFGDTNKYNKTYLATKKNKMGHEL